MQLKRNEEIAIFLIRGCEKKKWLGLNIYKNIH